MQRGRVLARPTSCGPPSLKLGFAVTRPSNPCVVLQIADVSAQIEDTKLQLVQNQKRLENRLAKGADVTELRSAIAVLMETLTHLEARKALLREQGQALSVNEPPTAG